MAQTLTGGCLCGAVRYKVSADLIFSGKCYCEDCRKTSGSGHGSVYAVPEQSVAVTGKLTEFKKKPAAAANRSRGDFALFAARASRRRPT